MGMRKQNSELPIVHLIILEHEEMVRFLLERGAVLGRAKSGGEALWRAAAGGLETMMHLLIERGVKANRVCVDGAVERRHGGIADLLRQHLDDEIPG
ncbi:hypothetical protein K469DRAFT_711535 [Zopfia rhizophila CBS 207.26]|uniref:Ankyrin n=1 Tax=Zopfia rhizophila CBS 207.26 TaxID=1314779 RepID=A0A6A6DT74_9PEZI|nr:hypothetical protein K469DRAFT_711535 [Zopfia rhizophila CBS 207.26]